MDTVTVGGEELETVETHPDRIVVKRSRRKPKKASLLGFVARLVLYLLAFLVVLGAVVFVASTAIWLGLLAGTKIFAVLSGGS